MSSLKVVQVEQMVEENNAEIHGLRQRVDMLSEKIDRFRTGDGVAELAVPFCIWTNPAVAVVDVAQKRVIAAAHGPDASNRTAALLFTPAGHRQKYPVLSPGYGEGTDTCV